MPKTDYDEFAEAYAADNEVNLLNGHYERPEMLRLCGEVAGQRVLDAGCGAGLLSAELRKRGADITGFDLSAAMVALARKRLGVDADLAVADLSEPLRYDSASFDLAVSSLVLHYLPDWTVPLAELRRILKPGGRLIVSVNHPMLYPALNPGADYFAVTEFTYQAEHGDRLVVYTNWHRPLHAMSEAFSQAGFSVSTISEPAVAPGTPPELLPPTARTRFLSFIFFVLT